MASTNVSGDACSEIQASSQNFNEATFIESKQLLKSASVLVHFDPKKKLILACDAPPYGVGAVLSHKMEDGCDKPIAYTPRALTSAEKNYSVLEKESLAIIFVMKKIKEGTVQEKFNRFLFNYHITPQTTTGLAHQNF
ncbi:Hypothetical predicted protein [Mytilus galloprovincialis]|uniref:Reverse transcriptase/retrotransposon-derived protein RNase H-like domain-containing protein n=1 Tax=Mytilus galloprovincialis TaxID=29158 RepID=A0A8B6HIN9_MYTGA|nr:Hypothetical predicted protein [Mytilus galloprovincialis]